MNAWYTFLKTRLKTQLFHAILWIFIIPWMIPHLKQCVLIDKSEAVYLASFSCHKIIHKTRERIFNNVVESIHFFLSSM